MIFTGLLFDMQRFRGHRWYEICKCDYSSRYHSLSFNCMLSFYLLFQKYVPALSLTLLELPVQLFCVLVMGQPTRAMGQCATVVSPYCSMINVAAAAIARLWLVRFC
jgi:hypothetical protein